MDAERGEKRALCDGPGDHAAGSGSPNSQGFEIDMRRQVGGTGIDQGRGRLSLSYRLQCVSGSASRRSIVDEQSRAIMAHDVTCNAVHEARSGFITFENGSDRMRRQIDFGHAFDESAVRDVPLHPAGLAADELTDRQSVEKLVRKEDQRSGGDVIERSMDLRPRQFRLQCSRKAR
jgi:hypothetical protein